MVVLCFPVAAGSLCPVGTASCPPWCGLRSASCQRWSRAVLRVSPTFPSPDQLHVGV